MSDGNLESMDFNLINEGDIFNTTKDKTILEILYILISNVLINNFIFVIQPIHLFFLSFTTSNEIIESHTFGFLLYYYCCIPLSIGAMAVFDSFASFFTGSSNYKNIRKVFYRARVVLFILYVLVLIPLAIYSESLYFSLFESLDSLLFLKEFMLISVHGIYILLNHILNLKYLQALGNYDFCIMINFFFVLLHTSTSYLFIIRYKLAIIGAAYSILLSSSIIFFISLRFLVVYSRVEINLYKFKNSVFINPHFFNFLKLSLGSALINFLQFLFYFLIIFDSFHFNYLDTADLIIINYLYIIKCFGYAISQTLVHLLFTNFPMRNTEMIYMTMNKILKITVAICTILSILNLLLARLYFDKENTDYDILQILWMYSIFIYIDYALTFITSITLSLGKYNVISLFTFLSFITVIFLIKIIFSISYKGMWYIYIMISSLIVIVKLILFKWFELSEELLEKYHSIKS